MTNCICPIAGYCDRHQVSKSEHWHDLCRSRDDYFAAWEKGRGPGQVVEEAKEHRKKQREQARGKRQRLIEWIKWFRVDSDKGVGDTVERLLAKVGGRKIKSLIESLGGSCGCTNRQKWLNQVYPYKS